MNWKTRCTQEALGVSFPFLCLSLPLLLSAYLHHPLLSLQVGFLYNLALCVICLLSASLCTMRQSFSSHYYLGLLESDWPSFSF